MVNFGLIPSDEYADVLVGVDCELLFVVLNVDDGDDRSLIFKG